MLVVLVFHCDMFYFRTFDINVKAAINVSQVRHRRVVFTFDQVLSSVEYETLNLHNVVLHHCRLKEYHLYSSTRSHTDTRTHMRAHAHKYPLTQTQGCKCIHGTVCNVVYLVVVIIVK